ncbi:universal stress protein [Streptomyces griseoincarnatus]
MSPQPLAPTSSPTLTRPADTGSPVPPLSLPHPVTALVTNRPDDLAVVDAAVRLAAPRKAPVLLVAVVAAPSQIPDGARVDAQAARVSLARVLPRLRAAGVGYIPATHRVPADGGGQPRLQAAGGVLALAARHHSPLVVASSRGPAGLDAHSLIEAYRACRRRGAEAGGPVTRGGAQCVDARPAPPAHGPTGGVMNGLHTLAPWWLLALVDLVVGGLCLALALRPRRRRTTTAVRRPA